MNDEVWYEFAGNPFQQGRQRVAGEDGLPAWEKTPPPSQEDAIIAAQLHKTTLMQAATDAIAPLQDALDLNIATDEERVQLNTWKEYRILLNRIDHSKAPDIDWPEKPY